MMEGLVMRCVMPLESEEGASGGGLAILLARMGFSDA